MFKSENVSSRSFVSKALQADLVIVGGGLSGVCCAITAARAGLRVVLVQDRPVLGGNASSEVRLWVLGATSHMGNNNRWAREGGVIDEILVENMCRNPEGNAVIFDTVLLDKVVSEPNITLLLNTAVIEVTKADNETISSVKGFCSQNATQYILSASLFCDASGDGVVGFLAGAAFRMGAESKEEFGEQFAPSAEYGELLGHSLYFYTKDTGRPVNFVPPGYALNDITRIPRYRKFNTREYGCNLWWIEYGGRLDTVHETETIKWELWKIVYGVWNYIKNSGNFPEAQNLTLEWVGMIPGKRESRRFEGDYILRQQDIVERKVFDDAVAYGGWSIDLHPADGVFSEKPGCNQWHSKGIYSIPYRCFYSHNIRNLFLAGRIISASHVAFGSSRVMATGAYGAQAVGMAAALCHQNHITPRELASRGLINTLQQALLKSGQHIPGVVLKDEQNLAVRATVSASSELLLSGFTEDLLKPLDLSVAQMLPLEKGDIPSVALQIEADQNTTLEVELRISSNPNHYTPDVTLETRAVSLNPGRHTVTIVFTSTMPESTYAFIVFRKTPGVRLYFSKQRTTGVLSVYNLVNESVSNYGKQTPPRDIGVEEFEFWCPQRRPEGHNLSIRLDTALRCFAPANVINGIARPTNTPNAWVASPADAQPSLTLRWETPQTIKTIIIKFDTDFDHPMETVLLGHPESVMPFCVRRYTITDSSGNVLYSKTGNHQTINTIVLDAPVVTSQLIIRAEHPSPEVPAAIFEVLCYE